MTQTDENQTGHASVLQHDTALNEPPRQAWHSDWGNFLLVGLVIYVGTYLLWLGFESGTGRTFTLVREIAFLPLTALGILLAGRASRFTELDRKSRRAWTLIAIGFVFWLFGDACWAYFAITDQVIPVPSLTDIGYLGRILFLIVGVLSFPTNRVSHVERTKLRLDSGIILLGYTILAGYLVIAPGLLDRPVGFIEGGLLLMYLFSGVLIMLATLGVLAHRPAAVSACALLLLAGGVFFYTLAGLWWGFLEARNSYVFHEPTYALWIIGEFLIVASPQIHRDFARRRLTRSLTAITNYTQRALPYLATGLAIAVVSIAGIPNLVASLGPVALLMVVLTVLVAARYVATLRENTQLQIERVIRQSEERFQALVEYSSDLITVVNRQFQCIYQSPSSREITGVEAQSLTGTNFLDWMHQDDRDDARAALQRIIDERQNTVTLEWRLSWPEAEIIHLESIISNEIDNPNVGGLVINSRDISERKLLEAELTYRAYHDPLTGLPNRDLFQENLAAALDDVAERQGVALLFLDIDYFKLVNDTLGHDVGDDLLFQVSQRLREGLRPEDGLGRLGGDEFSVLVRNLTDLDHAVAVANRILEALNEPMMVAGRTTRIAASIGIAFTLSRESTPSDLLRHADAAMYTAKRNGRNRIEVFEPGMEAELRQLSRGHDLTEWTRSGTV